MFKTATVDSTIHGVLILLCLHDVIVNVIFDVLVLRVVLTTHCKLANCESVNIYVLAVFSLFRLNGCEYIANLLIRRTAVVCHLEYLK